MKQLKKLGALALSAALAAGLLLGSAFTLQAKADGEATATVTMSASNLKDINLFSNEEGTQFLNGSYDFSATEKPSVTLTCTVSSTTAQPTYSWEKETKAAGAEDWTNSTSTSLTEKGSSLTIPGNQVSTSERYICEIKIGDSPVSGNGLFCFNIIDSSQQSGSGIEWKWLDGVIKNLSYPAYDGNDGNSCKADSITNSEPMVYLPLGYSGKVTFSITKIPEGATVNSIGWYDYDSTTRKETTLAEQSTSKPMSYEMDVENLPIQHHVMAQINYDGKYYSIANFWLKLGAGIQAKKDTDKTSNSLSVQYNNTSSPDLTFAVTAKSSVSDAPLTYRWFWYDPSSANTSHEVSGSSSTYTLTETGIKQNRVYVCVATDSYGNTGMIDFPISVTLANETVTKTKAEGNNAFNATVNNEDGGTGSSVVIVPATDNSIPNDTTIAVTASAISENRQRSKTQLQKPTKQRISPLTSLQKRNQNLKRQLSPALQQPPHILARLSF